MNKKIVSFVLLSGLATSSTQAASLFQSNDLTFDAINHTIISDNVLPATPSPGDTFIVNGLGTLNVQSTIEFSFSYNIAGSFVDYSPSDGKLYFNHGIEMEGVSNQLTLYANFGSPFGTSAVENSASSYTDGFKVLTMDVLFNPNELGFLNTFTGQGEDQITFKLTDIDKQKFGLINNDLLLKLSTNITSSIDPTTGQPFNFGAFDNACGPLPFNSCGRETGTASLTLTPPTDQKVVHTPIPAAFGLLLSGFGLLSWMRLGSKKTA